MKPSAMLLEDFLKNPLLVKKEIKQMEMANAIINGVCYEGIVNLTNSRISIDIVRGLKKVYPNARATKTFAKYSLEQMKPPNWAKSDKNQAEMIALIFLNEKDAIPTTSILQHDSGFYTHPSSPREESSLRDDSSNTFKWLPRHVFRGHFNDCWIMNSKYIYGEGCSFGRTKDSGRLVITCFFDI